MAIFVDSSRYAEIQKYCEWGICSGVTMNPKILADEGAMTPEDMEKETRRIVLLVKGPVSVELVSETTGEMLQEARRYHGWEPDYIAIKVPMSAAGMPVVNALTREGVRTNVTCMMNFNQAYLAALAGATYVSLFLGRIKDMGYDPLPIVASVREILDRERLGAQIIAGSIRHPQDVADALRAGAHIVTATPAVLEKSILNPQTDRTIDEFARMWAQFQARR
jgi:transaldolase